MDKTRQKCKNLNTSYAQSLVQYCQKQYLPSGVAILSHVGKPRAASAPGDDGFFSLLLELILFGVAT
jgi:hypothetical protein